MQPYLRSFFCFIFVGALGNNCLLRKSGLAAEDDRKPLHIKLDKFEWNEAGTLKLHVSIENNEPHPIYVYSRLPTVYVSYKDDKPAREDELQIPSLRSSTGLPSHVSKKEIQEIKVKGIYSTVLEIPNRDGYIIDSVDMGLRYSNDPDNFVLENRKSLIQLPSKTIWKKSESDSDGWLGSNTRYSAQLTP